MTAAASSSSPRSVRRARAKFAMPKIRPTRSRTAFQSAAGPRSSSMRPISGRTRTTSRPAVASRRLRTRRSTNHGRLRPLSAISW